MQKTINRTLLIIIAAMIFVLAYRFISKPSAEEINAKAITDIASALTPPLKVEKEPSLTKDEVEGIIKDYLMSHPEIIISAVEKLQKNNAAKTNNYLEEKATELKHTDDYPILGNHEGKYVIVMFYDYNCSFCKKADQYINQLIEKNSEIKVILRPFPILGENSLYLAKLALALYKIAPDKFKILHQNIMISHNSSKAQINDLLQRYDIDKKVIEEEIESSEIQGMLNKNFELAEKSSIRGAPAFIINGKLIPGLITASELEKMLKDTQGE